MGGGLESFKNFFYKTFCFCLKWRLLKDFCPCFRFASFFCANLNLNCLAWHGCLEFSRDKIFKIGFMIYMKLGFLFYFFLRRFKKFLRKGSPQKNCLHLCVPATTLVSFCLIHPFVYSIRKSVWGGGGGQLTDILDFFRFLKNNQTNLGFLSQ